MDLFESAPGICFYAKDADSRFVRLNRANLALYDTQDEEDLLGRSDRDFHPPLLAEAYIAEDQAVMRSGSPARDQLWMVPTIHGQTQWFVSTKSPLRDDRGECIGVAGVMHAIATPQAMEERFQRLTPAVRYLEQRFRETLDLADLRRVCNLSPTHLHRLFQQLTRLTPGEYQLALRVQEARTLLATTDRPLLDISLAVGFFDQSHFTKRFRRVTGMTPAAFRASFSTAQRGA